MLVVDNLEVSYQELRALRGVSMKIEEGDLVALIGSNGSGKTTFLNTVSGLYKPLAGEIIWNGSQVGGLPPDRICKLGIIQVPEGRKLFPQMTVEENLELGAYVSTARARLKQSFDKVYSLFPRVAERKKQAAGSLSGGEQQMVAVGRALMALPKLLMLDEPSLGLAPIMAQKIFKIVKQLNEDGMTILLVSQEVLQTLKIAKHAFLLENGKITLSGRAEEMLNDQQIKSSYLGI